MVMTHNSTFCNFALSNFDIYMYLVHIELISNISVGFHRETYSWTFWYHLYFLLYMIMYVIFISQVIFYVKLLW